MNRYLLKFPVSKILQVINNIVLFLFRSQIGRCHSRDSFKKQQNLQKAIDEARKLASKSPDVSRATTPLMLPDFTGAEIVKLVKEDASPDSKFNVANDHIIIFLDFFLYYN